MSSDARAAMFRKLASPRDSTSARSAFFSQLAGAREEASDRLQTSGSQSRRGLFQSVTAAQQAAEKPAAGSNAAESLPSDSEHLTLELIQEEVTKAASACPARPQDDLRSKRPHYNNKRREAKAAAAASLKKPKSSDEEKRMDQNRVQELVDREHCACSRGTCWNQFRPVFASLMTVMVAFATAAKGVRDEILRILG